MTHSERKWIDNLLSHFEIPGVERNQRGSPRRITPQGIYHIVLTRKLAVELDTTLRAAVAIAISLMRSPPPAELPMFEGFSLQFDRLAFEAAIDSRIAEAVEAVVPARRGRPPARR